MSSVLQRLFFLGCAISIGACGSNRSASVPVRNNSTNKPNQICTMVAVSGLNVEFAVPAGVSGSAFLNDLSITAQSGTSTETLEKFLDQSTVVFYGAFEKEGTHTLSFFYRGSLVGQFQSIPVRKDASGCHVETQHLGAAIQNSQIVLTARSY